MSKHKEALIDLIPEDCVAINEIIAFADALAAREKQAGWEKHEDANALRTALSRQLSSIATGKLERGCSWYDFAPDSAWIAEGKIDEISLRVFKAAEIHSRILNPGKGMHYHDTFASLVTACTTDPQIAEKVALVRKRALKSGVLDAHKTEFHEYTLEALENVRKEMEA